MTRDLLCSQKTSIACSIEPKLFLRALLPLILRFLIICPTCPDAFNVDNLPTSKKDIVKQLEARVRDLLATFCRLEFPIRDTNSRRTTGRRFGSNNFLCDFVGNLRPRMDDKIAFVPVPCC